jgi:hypothetical protein
MSGVEEALLRAAIGIVAVLAIALAWRCEEREFAARATGPMRTVVTNAVAVRPARAGNVATTVTLDREAFKAPRASTAGGEE